MSSSSRGIDRLEATFDHDGVIANAGLVAPATLMARLGIEALVNTGVKTGSALPRRKILTLVAAMIAGATHIDHAVAAAVASRRQDRPTDPSVRGRASRDGSVGRSGGRSAQLLTRVDSERELMPRPRDIGVIDLMLEIPAGGAVMSMEPARRLTRDLARSLVGALS